MCQAIEIGDTQYDFNKDRRVDGDDLDFFILDLLGTNYGDANLDGTFDSPDLVQVFQAGKYETGAPADWSSGDWDCDGDFDSGDLVQAFIDGGYTPGARPWSEISAIAAATDRAFAGV